jgi:hypothetical protein
MGGKVQIMNTSKIYYDTDGTAKTIHQMVRDNPYWAAERIQAGEEAIVEVGLLKQNMWPMKDAEIERWKSSYENIRDFAKNIGLVSIK